MPEEVKIVEFLQMANRKPLVRKKRKISVLISAWDVVTQKDATPADWFRQNRPMLSQFLEANEELWETQIYGVSAQGGKLPEKKAELAKLKHPSKRIRIVGNGALEHDLSAPLQWLIS
jgi:hypothetical protein